MKYNFVTIFNSLYLPQALALHQSIKKFGNNFKLWGICLDNESFNTISHIKDRNFIPINFQFYESEQLKKLKVKRTIAEYCWTITPIAPKLIFNMDKNIKFVTYVDADMFFLKDPKFLIDVFLKSEKYVSFSKHDFNEKDKAKENIYGKFCVQFMSFKKNKSEKIRKIWERNCINWCYAQPSNGRMGDQKYLEPIYDKFSKYIYVVDNDSFRSTWNYEKVNFKKIVGWHFHGFKIININFFLMHTLNFMPINIIKKIYIPYIKKINKIAHKIKFRKNQLIKISLLGTVINLIKFKLINYRILKRPRYYFLNN
jgi:hypothetical protein